MDCTKKNCGNEKKIPMLRFEKEVLLTKKIKLNI